MEPFRFHRWECSKDVYHVMPHRKMLPKGPLITVDSSNIIFNMLFIVVPKSLEILHHSLGKTHNRRLNTFYTKGVQGNI